MTVGRNAEFDIILLVAVAVCPSFAHIKGSFMSNTSLQMAELVSNYILKSKLLFAIKTNQCDFVSPGKRKKLSVLGKFEESYISSRVASGRGDGCKQWLVARRQREGCWTGRTDSWRGKSYEPIPKKWE